MNSLEAIKKRTEELLRQIPEDVILLAAAKTRTLAEVQAAYKGGIRYFGHNYVQEAQEMIEICPFEAKWHLIGHLQRNKAKEAAVLFDMVETLDSIRLANELEKRCGQIEKTMPVLIEINSGKEESKTGLLPGKVDELVEHISGLKHIQLKGLMTMGPFTGDPELSRPYFTKTRKIFEKLKSANHPNVEMKYLSMGMSNSYRVAIEEGANIVRIGTGIFGPRQN